ncbi:uncharacterized protein LOC125804686 [Astyanax mexicanus]|uniref:uncharacterized protein LOC125804686 n=1 Tax=Astyanax mexicanus TaxID=7994 RepID=UPI0020CAC3BB|nr:uncharacterized protein LOC125804686 [Astyanax mexicanus]
MPRKKSFRMRRAPKTVSTVVDVQCCCDSKLVGGLVCGTKHFRLLDRNNERTEICSVLGLIRHKVSNVCTWKAGVMDSICDEGRILLEERKPTKGLAGRYNAFNRVADVSLGKVIRGSCDYLEFSSALQETLLDQQSCLLNLDGYHCAVVYHNEYFIVLDFNACNSSGLPCDFGVCVAQFHTSLNETMLFFTTLLEKLKAKVFSVASVMVRLADEQVSSMHCPSTANGMHESPVKISEQKVCVPEGVELKECYVNLKRMANDKAGKSTVQTPKKRKLVKMEAIHDSDVQCDINSVRCVQGSFHQGHSRFGRNGGRQCVANSLAAMVMHEKKNVIGWNTKNLDSVLISGNKFYSFCRTQGLITDGSEKQYLLVTDLPQTASIVDSDYTFTFSDPVVGDVNVEDGELLRSGIAYSLISGLEKIFSMHDRCFFTYDQRTCAIIRVNDQFALIDSDARDVYGRTNSQGKSIVLYFSSLHDIVALVHEWVLDRETLLESNDFEITGVDICPAVSNLENNESCLEGVVGNTSECMLVDDSSSCDSSEDTHDVTFMKEMPSVKYQFSVLSKDVAEAICNKLNVSFEEKSGMVPGRYGDLGKPCRTENIVGDGNCFFRCISQIVSGNQAYHRRFRLAIVKHMQANEAQYSTDIRQDYTSLKEYLDRSRMNFVGSWATEIEIQAAADFLGVDVYTYTSDKWLKFHCRGSKITEDGIFLAHRNGNHYETVVCVKHGSCHDCHKLCKIHELMNACPLQTRAVGSKQANSQSLMMEDQSNEKNKCTLKRKETDLKHLDRKKKCLNVIETDCGKVTQNTATNVTFLWSSPKQIKSKYMREKKKNEMKRQYKMNVIHRNQKKMYTINKYKRDTGHRLKIIMSSKIKYAKDEKHRLDVQNRSKSKYATNTEFSKAVRKSSKDKYATNTEFSKAVRKSSKDKYATNTEFSKAVRKSSKDKYATNTEFSKAVRKSSKDKYATNTEFSKAVRKSSKHKYATNTEFSKALRKRSKDKYATNTEFSKAVRKRSKDKYATNTEFSKAVRKFSKDKYAGDPEFRCAVHEQVKTKRSVVKQNQQCFSQVLKDFNSIIREGPDFVCCVCHRLLFKHQVSHCKMDKYKTTKEMQAVAEQCITEDYLHKFDHVCDVPCLWLTTSKCQLWICHNCDFKLSHSIMPPESVLNNLQLEPVPPELSCLNSLEQHLIALHIQFMKLLALPKGAQNGVHGPVTCVPSNVVDTTNLLPRANVEGSLLRVKLKRKLTYKGHYEYKYVNTEHVKRALQYLKQNNPYYADINYNENWLNEFEEESLENMNENNDSSLSNNVQIDTEQSSETQCYIVDNELNQQLPTLETNNGFSVEETEQPHIECDETLHDRQTHGMFMDTCLQPVDLGQEILDQYDNILNIAPAEGNNPIRLLSDKSNEAKSFPALFPMGGPTFHDFRNQRLTLSRYFNNRILSADKRFANNNEYIFYAQYMSEVEQVSSSISIAMRKGHNSNTSREFSAELVKDRQTLKQFLNCDDGYRFLRPIRGTPVYWSGVQKDLFAMVRQLGIPTFFCSFSSADMRWDNLLQSMLQQEDRTDSVDSLDWADKCGLLRRNPVIAARMFDFRWHTFLNKVILSPSNPIGRVVDYFYRVEFQQRGSPHVHAMFWVDNAPQIDKDNDNDVVKFIDQYISSELPSNDSELVEIVSTVQMHSRRHSKTCRKRNSVCRFNFPRPPSNKTFISRKKREEESTKKCSCSAVSCACSCEVSNKIMNKEQATKILAMVKSAISTDTNTSSTVSELFDSIGIDQEKFELAYNIAGKKTQVVLKREITDLWVNPYNKNLLKAWNANMDIQYIVDAYACIVYIISYISKAEKEMGLLLSAAHREASKHNNVDVKGTLQQLGSVYLHNRDVGAQEAVYRLTNMHLKEASRKVEYIPTGDHCVRLSLPLKVLQQKAQSNELTEKAMWMTNHVDRYKARPVRDPFQNMCIAVFVSQYRVVGRTEKCADKIQLQNNAGFVKKRTRSKPAIVRYARFSVDSNPEKYYQSILQLFLPYRCENDLKPADFPTFELFYHNGQYELNGTVQYVKNVVDANKQLFEKDDEILAQVQHVVVDNGNLEDAWCEMCPEQEAERLECQEEKTQRPVEAEEHVDKIPDLSVQSRKNNCFERNLNVLCRSDALNLLRSLNSEQKDTFYQVRQWCLEKVRGKQPEPFHMFITGGAGTGKTHLIRSIHYEATRLLSQVSSAPDKVSVLLTAPTGIAAFNLEAGTIHSTFSIGTDVKLPYTPLGEEKFNTLRVLLSDLHILIIDEISMVDHNLLAYIHGRLRQIKQTGDYSPFGKVSVIAVGDFFQLPPVKGKPLYLENAPLDLWNGMFSKSELTTIVRQKDSAFAEILNRLRTHHRSTPLSLQDVKTLKQRETGETTSALHIFATNAQVEEHNVKQIIAFCPEHICVEAQDYEKNRQTGKMQLKNGHFSKVFNSCLPEKLLIGEGARVMLIKNIDVTDGLVNGVCGTVTDIAHDKNSTLVKTVFVQFDDQKVGQNTRKRIPPPRHILHSTPVNLEEERVNSKGGLRKQFPLKLAWACTVHKVQGLTVKQAVVSLKKIFAPGQAYVALSRVETLSGLIIQDFANKAIYCRSNIQECINNMAQFSLYNVSPIKTQNSFSVFLMNVQGLSCHLLDLTASVQPFNYNCIAVTETWLPANVSGDSTHIEGYQFHSAPRCLAYNSDNPLLKSIQQQKNGGVGIYCKHNIDYTILDISGVNVECMICQFNKLDIIVVVIYRPPQYQLSLFQKYITKLCNTLSNLSDNIFIIGDWNHDELKTQAMSTFMANLGYSQCVTECTTENGTLIDHVYKKITSKYIINTQVMPVYFSSHEAIYCTFSQT